jgi:hypothetical protein
MTPATHPIYAAHEHGDFSSVEWADPQIEYVVAGRGKKSGVDLEQIASEGAVLDRDPRVRAVKGEQRTT